LKLESKILIPRPSIKDKFAKNDPLLLVLKMSALETPGVQTSLMSLTTGALANSSVVISDSAA